MRSAKNCAKLGSNSQRSDDRVAVIASSEDEYFSVGADVKEFPTNMWHALPGFGVELDKPVIAATSGWVVGGAFVDCPDGRLVRGV